MPTAESPDSSNSNNFVPWFAFFLYAISSIASFAIGLDCAIIAIHWMHLYYPQAQLGLLAFIGLCAISGLVLNWILYQADAFEALYDFCLGIKQHCTKTNLLLLLIASLIVTATVMCLVVPHVAFLSTLTGITRLTACTALILSGIIVLESCMRLMTSYLIRPDSTSWRQCVAAICSNIIPLASAVCMGLFTYHAYALNPAISLSMPYIIIFSLAYAIGTFTLMRRSIAKLMISFSHQPLLRKVKEYLLSDSANSLASIKEHLNEKHPDMSYVERNLVQLLSREDLFNEVFDENSNDENSNDENSKKYSMDSTTQEKNHPLQSWGLGVIPIVLFFTTYLSFGLLTATLACICTTILQIKYIHSHKDRADTTQQNIILSTPFILAILGTAVCWKDGVLSALGLLGIVPAVATPLTYLFVGAMVLAEIFFCIDLTRKILIQLKAPAKGEDQPDQSMPQTIFSQFKKNRGKSLCLLLVLIPIGLNGFANGIIAVSDPITYAQFGLPLLILGVMLSFSIMANETSGLKSTALWPDKLPFSSPDENQAKQNQLSPQHRRIFLIISFVGPLSVMAFYFDQQVGVILLNAALSAAHLSTSFSIPIAAVVSLAALLFVGVTIQSIANKYNMFEIPVNLTIPGNSGESDPSPSSGSAPPPATPNGSDAAATRETHTGLAP